MKQLPKFLIAHNVAVNPDALYLVHTQQPRFIGLVIPKNNEIEQVDFIFKKYNFSAGCRTNRLPAGEYYIMGVVMWIDTPDEATTPKLMSRTGDWLFNYMKQIQNDNKASF